MLASEGYRIVQLLDPRAAPIEFTNDAPFKPNARHVLRQVQRYRFEHLDCRPREFGSSQAELNDVKADT
jgi:hypothetical protein